MINFKSSFILFLLVGEWLTLSDLLNSTLNLDFNFDFLFFFFLMSENPIHSHLTSFYKSENQVPSLTKTDPFINYYNRSPFQHSPDSKNLKKTLLFSSSTLSIFTCEKVSHMGFWVLWTQCYRSNIILLTMIYYWWKYKHKRINVVLLNTEDTDLSHFQ